MKQTLYLFHAVLLCVTSATMAATADSAKKAAKAKSVKEVYALLGVQSPEPGKRVLLEAPDIAATGAKVAVKVVSKIPGTDWMAVLVDRNSTPLVLTKDFSPGADHTVAVAVNLAQTSRVRAVVRAGGKYYEVAREVKLATNDCDKP